MFTTYKKKKTQDVFIIFKFLEIGTPSISAIGGGFNKIFSYQMK